MMATCANTQSTANDLISSSRFSIRRSELQRTRISNRVAAAAPQWGRKNTTLKISAAAAAGGAPASPKSRAPSGGKIRELWKLEHLERCFGADEDEEENSRCSTPCREDETLNAVRVAYQGNPGAYSHAVVDELAQLRRDDDDDNSFRGINPAAGVVDAVPCREFEAVFRAVESWAADQALVPIQNSLDGSVHRNYDLLLRHSDSVQIVAELQWQVQHCLMVHPANFNAKIERVVAHPQILEQCRNTLTSVLGFPASALQPTDDATSAAIMLADGELPPSSTAVIASGKAAEIFGLQAVYRHVNAHDQPSVTRFLHLARSSNRKPSRSDGAGLSYNKKSTLAFAFPDGGASLLSRALSAFALRDIVVSGIESRPLPAGICYDSQAAKSAGFKYVFVVDIDADAAVDVRAQNAIRQIQEIAPFVRVLGTYPVHHVGTYPVHHLGTYPVHHV